MTDSTTTRRDGSAPARAATVPSLSPSDVRAERRRLIESIRALRRLLGGRRSFELADRRRLNREARDRGRAEAAHGKALQRIHERQARQEASLTRRLNGLDGKRDSQERQALAVLRRESIERTLGSTYLTSSEVNGIGRGLVRDLAAQGIRTAADFTRVSWGRAPNGRGGDVLYIHRAKGGKVHINGIGEHRGRPLMDWRRSAVARAEARAPRELPPDERHRIAEIIEAERTRLGQELAEVPRTAEAARAEAVRSHAEVLDRLAAGHREAAERARERRAEFDSMAEQLRDLQARLSAHIDRYGDAGRRITRAQARALRPLPDVPLLPAMPSPRTSSDSESPITGTSHPRVSLIKATGGPQPQPAPGVRASLGWLVPIVFFAMTAMAGAGEPDATAPLWFSIGTRLVALTIVVDLVRLWIPRRRWRTASPMPSGTGPLATGTLLALAASGMFIDPEFSTSGAPWAVSVASGFFLLGGVLLRTGKGKSNGAPS
ncbi:hypothetical protein H0H10_18915 [Streptomyces sp. TRM S81-3]|uniref:Uncharacterized protein n=1 Tax=Streptomyces griseicoloratus TaxID=2752516 RepID=A0A926L2E6_9ACTN|nr:hypothetical protein [Streptomyces griseicoloratus]MBD0421198.1 hypothetical protein [Streptomyces griseicoloratus]